MKRAEDVINRIEDDLLDGKPIADVLRRVVTLGGYIGSSDLDKWASKELNGYEPEDDTPSYRVVYPSLYMRCETVMNGRKDLPIDYETVNSIEGFELEEFWAMTHPIAVLDRYTKRDRVLKVRVSDTEYIHDQLAYQGIVKVTDIFYRVTEYDITEIVDRVRTKLAEILREIRESTPADSITPSEVNTAVNVIIHNMSLTNIKSGERSRNSITVD